jgi:hypothetical protein
MLCTHSTVNSQQIQMSGLFIASYPFLTSPPCSIHSPSLLTPWLPALPPPSPLLLLCISGNQRTCRGAGAPSQQHWCARRRCCSAAAAGCPRRRRRRTRSAACRASRRWASRSTPATSPWTTPGSGRSSTTSPRLRRIRRPGHSCSGSTEVKFSCRQQSLATVHELLNYCPGGMSIWRGVQE